VKTSVIYNKKRGSLDLNKYRAVIFDLFHTLTSLESTQAPGKGTADILGIPREEWNKQLWFYSADRLKGKIRDPFEIIRKMAHVINPHISEEVIKEATNNRINRFKYSLEHIDLKTIDTLQRLKAMGKLLGLISNSDVNEILGWKNSLIQQYFDSTIFSCHVGYIKPERKIFEICLRELDVKPQETLFVGDGGSNELKGAQDMGMITVMTVHVIKHLWPEEIEVRRKHADYEIDEIRELLGQAIHE
jgi:putative hydrolase of the HAD superfamily